MATSHERVKLAQDIVKRTTQRLTGAQKEAQARHAAGNAQRIASPTILTANDVSGDYDAKRLLMTTLGGVMRPISNADLRAFGQNRALFKRQFLVKGRGKSAVYQDGITAQQVIDMSLAIDKKRANDEIRTAVPVGVQGDVMHFITNAGPDSDAVRHHVHVQFLELDAEFNNPVPEKDKRKLGKQIATGKLKFQCDCGRYRYWFRYLASIGNYAYGLQEQGYPKIKNPALAGVACKHVLRTMHNIQRDQTIRTKLIAQLEKMRAKNGKDDLKYEREKAADVRAHGAKMASKSERSHNLKMAPSKGFVDKRAKAAAQMMAKRAADKARRETTGDARKVAAAQKKALAGIQQLLKFGGITQAQYDAMAANLGTK
jgi:hypothetical protein